MRKALILIGLAVLLLALAGANIALPTVVSTDNADATSLIGP